MTDTALCPTDVDRLKRLLLDMAQQRSVDTVLKLIVDQLNWRGSQTSHWQGSG